MVTLSSTISAMNSMLRITFLALTFVLMGAPVFAQSGKLKMVNDSNHLFVLGAALPADAGLAGGTTNAGHADGALPANPLPSGISLRVGLYSGTNASSLILNTFYSRPFDASFTNGPGLIKPNGVMLNVPGGVVQYFRMVIWDQAFATPEECTTYRGYSSIFTAIPGTSITYPSILPDSPANSTWWPENLVVNAVDSPAPANIFCTATSDRVILSWSTNHLGWSLESNGVDIANAVSWHDVPGSTVTNTIGFQVQHTSPPAFFRLRSP